MEWCQTGNFWQAFAWTHTLTSTTLPLFLHTFKCRFWWDSRGLCRQRISFFVGFCVLFQLIFWLLRTKMLLQTLHTLLIFSGLVDFSTSFFGCFYVIDVLINPISSKKARSRTCSGIVWFSVCRYFALVVWDEAFSWIISITCIFFCSNLLNFSGFFLAL